MVSVERIRADLTERANINERDPRRYEKGATWEHS